MESILFVKEKFIEAVASSDSSIEDVKSLFDSSSKVSNYSLGAKYTYINRKIYLKEAFEALNSKSQKLILIGGFQGTGKTELIKSVIFALEESVLNFNYECSKITNLDDIILTLYGYLNRLLGKEADFQRISKLYGPQSIDESLFAFLKNLKRPLLIAFDGFENLVRDDLRVDEDLVNFLNFLLSLPMVKLIVSGRKIPSLSAFKIKESNLLTIRLSGLDESDAVRILRDNGVEGSNNTLYQAYQVTRGYPESLLWFITGIKHLNTDAFQIIQEHSSVQESFEEFISKKVYQIIPDELKKIVWLLASIRHPVRFAALHKLNIVENIESNLEYLVSRMILTDHDNSFYIKSFLKSIIYSSIPPHERIRIHRYLHELYSEQIPLKIGERVFHISRKILHSEQYYHYTTLTDLEKGSPSSGITWRQSGSDPLLPKTPIKQHYTVSAIDTSAFDNINIQYEEKESDKDSSFQDEIVLEDGFKLELTEEEKILLKDVNIQPETEKKETYIPAATSNIKTDLLDIARKYEENQDYSQAINQYKKVLELCQKDNDIEEAAGILSTIGNILGTIQRYDDSLNYLIQALGHYTSLNDKNNVNKTILNIGNAYNESYKHDIALQYYNSILNNTELNENDPLVIEALTGIGDIYDYKGSLESALKYYHDAYNKALTSDNKALEAKLCFKIALIYDDTDKTDKAFEFYHKNVKASDNITINPYLASSYANMAAIQEDSGKKEQAIAYYIKSLEADRLSDNSEGQYKTLSRLGNLYLELGNKDKAYIYFHEELRASKQTGDPYSIAMSYLEIGDFLFAQKLYEKAIKAFIMARKSIGKTISTDSKEKIDRRFRQIIAEIGENTFNEILENAKRKNG